MREELDRCISIRDERRAGKSDPVWVSPVDEHYHHTITKSDKDRLEYQHIDDQFTVLYTELMNDLTLPSQPKHVNKRGDISVLLAQLRMYKNVYLGLCIYIIELGCHALH